MWPCGLEQLDCALQAAQTGSSTNAVVMGPDNIEWHRNATTIRKRRIPVNLTPLESEIMHVLWKRRALYTSPDQILQHVWRGSIATNQNVYVYTRNLQRKLELVPARPRILLSRYGMGYQLAAPCQGSGRKELADAR